MTRSANRWNHVALVLGAASYACLLFVWFLLPAFLSPVIADLSLSNWQAGVLVGAVPLTYIPLSLLSGLAIDRVGPRLGVGLGLSIFGLAGAGRSVAADFPSLLACTLLVGVGATGITFGLPKLVADLFPPERTGSASTVYVLGSYAGSAGAFAVGRPLLGPALGGWRPTFLYTGLAAVAFALVWGLATARIEPRSGDESRTFSLGSLREDADRVLSNPAMLLLVVVGTAYLSASHGLQGWLVTLFEARGVRPALAGLTTTVLVAGQVVGALSLPPLSDRLSARRPAVVLSGMLVTGGTLVLLVAESALVIAALGIVAVGIGLGGVGPLLRAIPVELEGIGPGLTATAVGFVFAVGELGGFLGPFLVGSLRDLTGSFAPGLTVIALAGIAIAAAGWRMTGVDS
ncbi:MFS transporter [Halalkalicoccus sp. NIPERK01]|uniref:MFS transporter n=1 Tax=Halalkalicoccus sp. NIPERK01 TaxID=3053469 RepID=UPI00256F3EE8|nr:MFS transporter [Halalkalicoccus sp. NIPERK01]